MLAGCCHYFFKCCCCVYKVSCCSYCICKKPNSEIRLDLPPAVTDLWKQGDENYGLPLLGGDHAYTCYLEAVSQFIKMRINPLLDIKNNFVSGVIFPFLDDVNLRVSLEGTIPQLLNNLYCARLDVNQIKRTNAIRLKLSLERIAASLNPALMPESKRIIDYNISLINRTIAGEVTPGLYISINRLKIISYVVDKY